MIDPHAAADGRDELPVQARRPLSATPRTRSPRASPSTASCRSGHFAETGAELFSMGAGGSTIAITWHLMRPRARRRPCRRASSSPTAASTGSTRSAASIARSARTCRSTTSWPRSPTDNDARPGALKPGSLVINATGLGKDAPGSPLTDAVPFPASAAIAWDLNYRGDLVFLDQAERQAGRASCRSRTAGPTSSTAGRRSSPRCSTSTSRPTGPHSTSSRASPPRLRGAERVARASSSRRAR